MYGMNLTGADVAIACVIVGVIGWGVIEAVSWLFSFVSITIG